MASAALSDSLAAEPQWDVFRIFQVMALPVLLAVFFLSAYNVVDWQRAAAIEARAETRFMQVLSIAFFVGALGLGLLRSTVKLRTYCILFLVFSVYLFLITPLSLVPFRSLMFTIAFVAFVIAACGFWTLSPEQRRLAYFLGAVAIILSSAFLFAILPWRNRSVGGMPPNQFSHAAMVAIVLLIMSQMRMRYLVMVPAVVLMIHTNGRTAMACLFISLFVVILMNRNSFSRRNVLMMLSGLISGLVLVTAFEPFQAIYSFLSLDDQQRGIGSGFTGRVYYWEQFSDVASGSEIFGLGLQTRMGLTSVAEDTSNLHSGLLNCIAEIGIIGCMLYAILLVVCGLLWFQRARLHSLEAICIFAFLFSMPIRLILEPTYASIWQPAQVLMWLAVAGAMCNWSDSAPLAKSRRPNLARRSVRIPRSRIP